MPVGFVGEALLFLIFARGGFAGAFYPAGDPCVEGFGGDALSGELFGSLIPRLCGFLSVRIHSVQ